jgi:hypothetical protein
MFFPFLLIHFLVLLLSSHSVLGSSPLFSFSAWLFSSLLMQCLALLSSHSVLGSSFFSFSAWLFFLLIQFLVPLFLIQCLVLLSPHAVFVLGGWQGAPWAEASQPLTM